MAFQLDQDQINELLALRVEYTDKFHELSEIGMRASRVLDRIYYVMCDEYGATSEAWKATQEGAFTAEWIANLRDMASELHNPATPMFYANDLQTTPRIDLAGKVLKRCSELLPGDIFHYEGEEGTDYVRTTADVNGRHARMRLCGGLLREFIGNPVVVVTGEGA